MFNLLVSSNGDFVGALGRPNVCALRKGNVEIPTDYAGVVYVEMDAAGAWKRTLAKEEGCAPESGPRQVLENRTLEVVGSIPISSTNSKYVVPGGSEKSEPPFRFIPQTWGPGGGRSVWRTLR